jgi:predicted acetyltransferase
MAHAWKACWGNTLAGSNPASSAPMCSQLRPGRALRLRPPSEADEEQARQAHEELAEEGFDFLLDARDGEPWSSYLDRVDELRRGVDMPVGWVPATFLVAEVDGQLVGRVSIRHELNAFLAEFGGHIGYAVRPAFRRRGYAMDILRQSLHVARQLGVERALVTCDVDNVGSARVIEKSGGAFDGVAAGRDGVTARRRYWIDCTPD